MRRRPWFLLCAFEVACAAARCDERAPPAAGTVRLLDRMEAWTVESPWSPRPAATPEAGLTPAFAAEFEEGTAAGIVPVDLPVGFAERSLRPGTVLPTEPAAQPTAAAAARGARGLRFEHASGAAFAVVPVTPDTPYLLTCLVRRGVDPHAFASDGAALARAAQVGSLFVYELHELPPAESSPAQLLAAFGARANAIVATHVVSVVGAFEVFGESRILLKVLVFTYALAIGLINNTPN